MLLLLLLPSLAFASINVSMKGVIFYEDNKFNIVGEGNQKGFDKQIVTDVDLAVLNIDKEELKNMIGKVHGLKPDHVLVRSNENWGDIYGKKGWNQVQRKIEPDVYNYRLEFKKDDVVFTNTIYKNPTNKRKILQIVESKIDNDEVTCIWTEPILKGKKLNVEFDFEVDNVYIAAFKKDFVIGINRKLVTHKNFVQNHTVDLLPNQTVKARLEATKGTIIAYIPYKVTLFGDVVAKYNSLYKDKYFFNFDINQILAANQRSGSFSFEQGVQFGFYYDTQLRITDANEITLTTFAEEHGSSNGQAGKRKAAAEKQFESTGGVKLKRKSIPVEFIEKIHNAVVQETVNENEGSDETA